MSNTRRIRHVYEFARGSTSLHDRSAGGFTAWRQQSGDNVAVSRHPALSARWQSTVLCENAGARVVSPLSRQRLPRPLEFVARQSLRAAARALAKICRAPCRKVSGNLLYLDLLAVVVFSFLACVRRRRLGAPATRTLFMCAVSARGFEESRAILRASVRGRLCFGALS